MLVCFRCSSFSTQVFFHEFFFPTGTDVPVHLKVLCALRYMACGSFQIVMGDCSDLSQSCVSRCIKAVCTQLASLAHEFIKFPSIAEQQAISERFAAIAPMPGVIGCIDCTHVPIVSPGGENVEQFRNRKGFLSINVQAVCDADLKFTNFVCSWPGSAHDSRIFRNSAVCHLLERQDQEDRLCFLLGDGGYPCLSYLLTPLPNPSNDKEQRYNSAHIRIRNCVERSFGVLKRRFGCLSIPLRTQLDTSKRAILSCAVLHNIAISRGIPLPLDEEDPPVVPDHQNVDQPAPGQAFNAARGFGVRAHVIENYF